GQQISCTIPAGIATGGNVSFTIPVTPLASASGQAVSNTASASGGGGPAGPGAGPWGRTATDTAAAPRLQLQKSATPTTFVVGVAGTYTLTLTNVGTAATTNAVTITDVIPTGLQIDAVSAGCASAGQTVRCTVAAPLATNTPVTFTVTVTA